MAETAEGREGAVAFAYVYGDNDHRVSYSWHHSVVELVGWDLAHEGRVLRGGYVAYKCGTDGLAGSRNQAVKLFLEDDRADWLFWVDTDMGFPPDIIDRLFEAAHPVERPVVGGLAFTWREDTADGMGGWRTSPAPTIFDWKVLDDGQQGFMVRMDYPRDTLIRCAGTGSACVLIHRSVFERISASRDHRYTDGRPVGEHWYDRVFNATMGRLVSEDLSFCLRAGALGIPVHVHTGVRTTHQKTVWVAEEDYATARVLDALAPAVPPATEKTAIIVPVLWRPGNAAPFMESLAASGAGDLATVYAVADEADVETRAAWEQAGATVLVKPDGDHPGTFAEKANLGYQATSEPWLFLAGDDVMFHPGWLDQAQHAARDGADVVGTNDLHNPRVTAGEHATHMLIRRAYIDEVGASWDGPGVVACEQYKHWFCDDEIVAAAKQRGAFIPARYSKVEHKHPLWGLAGDDKTYQHGLQFAGTDRETFETRLAAHSA